MDRNKSYNADLSRHKPVAMLLGFVIALTACFVAIEWRDSNVSDFSFLTRNSNQFENNAIPITNNPLLAPPKPQEVPKVVEKINVVDNNVEINKDNEQLLTPEEDKSAVVELVETASDDDEGKEDEKKDATEVDESVANILDVMPEYPGGMVECMRFIQRNLAYPESCRRRGIQGKVMVQFIVNTDGSMSDVAVVESVDPILDRTALRVVRMLKRWKPGERKGKPVKVKFTLPVTFIIN